MTAPSDFWLPLRFRDLDAFGHVYHAEFLTLLDEARTHWFDDAGLAHPGSYVLARLEIDWVRPIGPDDGAVRVEFAVEAVGTSSVTLTETMYPPDGRVVSRSRSVTVRWDRATSSTRRLTRAERASLERLRP